MNRLSKLLFVVMAAAPTIAELRAGSPSQVEDATPVPSDPTTVSLTVERGNPSGRFAAGTTVTVTADAPPSGAHFAGWTGDVQILANPGLPTTRAIVPFTAVTITATYSATLPANDSPSADLQ